MRGSTLHDNGIYHAPPEVVTAEFDSAFASGVEDGATPRAVPAQPDQDMWALATMAYESLIGMPALDSETVALRCAQGRQPYPWDRAESSQSRAWRNAVALRAALEPCLACDVAMRPSAARVLEAVEAIQLDDDVAKASAAC